jgi:hypothetical protein
VETVACSTVMENFMACGTNAGALHIVDVSIPKIRSTNTLNEPVVKALFSRKEESVFVGTGDGKIYRIDPRVNKPVKEFIGPASPVLDFDITMSVLFVSFM